MEEEIKKENKIKTVLKKIIIIPLFTFIGGVIGYFFMFLVGFVVKDWPSIYVIYLSVPIGLVLGTYIGLEVSRK